MSSGAGTAATAAGGVGAAAAVLDGLPDAGTAGARDAGTAGAAACVVAARVGGGVTIAAGVGDAGASATGGGAGMFATGAGGTGATARAGGADSGRTGDTGSNGAAAVADGGGGTGVDSARCSVAGATAAGRAGAGTVAAMGAGRDGASDDCGGATAAGGGVISTVTVVSALRTRQGSALDRSSTTRVVDASNCPVRTRRSARASPATTAGAAPSRIVFGKSRYTRAGYSALPGNVRTTGYTGAERRRVTDAVDSRDTSTRSSTDAARAALEAASSNANIVRPATRVSRHGTCGGIQTRARDARVTSALPAHGVARIARIVRSHEARSPQRATIHRHPIAVSPR